MTSTSLKKQLVDEQVSSHSLNDPEGLGMINKHHEVLDLIYKYSHPTDKVLDVGCSDGKILKELEKAGYKYLYGIDIQSRAKTAFAKNSKINYQECDVEEDKLPFKVKFDLIIISDVLEHLYSPRTVLENLRNNLSSKGKIVISTPNAGWFLNGILLTFFPSKLFVSTAFGPWDHTHQFTFYEMNKLLPLLNYKILELKGGKLDNYAFRSGIKKILFDLFILTTSPFVKIYPPIFSAHIFAIFEK